MKSFNYAVLIMVFINLMCWFLTTTFLLHHFGEQEFPILIDKLHTVGNLMQIAGWFLIILLAIELIKTIYDLIVLIKNKKADKNG